MSNDRHSHMMLIYTQIHWNFKGKDHSHFLLVKPFQLLVSHHRHSHMMLIYTQIHWHFKGKDHFHFLLVKPFQLLVSHHRHSHMLLVCHTKSPVQWSVTFDKENKQYDLAQQDGTVSKSSSHFSSGKSTYGLIRSQWFSQMFSFVSFRSSIIGFWG